MIAGTSTFAMAVLLTTSGDDFDVDAQVRLAIIAAVGGILGASFRSFVLWLGNPPPSHKGWKRERQFVWADIAAAIPIGAVAGTLTLILVLSLVTQPGAVNQTVLAGLATGVGFVSRVFLNILVLKSTATLTRLESGPQRMDEGLVRALGQAAVDNLPDRVQNYDGYVTATFRPTPASDRVGELSLWFQPQKPDDPATPMQRVLITGGRDVESTVFTVSARGSNVRTLPSELAMEVPIEEASAVAQFVVVPLLTDESEAATSENDLDNSPDETGVQRVLVLIAQGGRTVQVLEVPLSHATDANG